MARFSKAQKVLFGVRRLAIGCSLTYLKSKNTTTGYWWGSRDADGWRTFYTFSVNGVSLCRRYGEESMTGVEEFPGAGTIDNVRKLSVGEIVDLIITMYDPALLEQKEVVTVITPSIAQHTGTREFAYTLYKNGTCPCGHRIGKKLRANAPCPKCGDPL